MEYNVMTVMQILQCNECKIMNEILQFDESNAINAM